MIKELRRTKTQLVHTHLFDANIIGLSAAYLLRIKKRIHTRHHSDFHHIYHTKAIKYDKLINFMSTDIVAISEVVKNILLKKENVSPEKVHLINHGFELEQFITQPLSAINTLEQKYFPINSYPIIGVISRYTEWKGIQYIIPAFEKIRETFPEALLVLANANGDYKTEIQKLLKGIPKKNFVEIPFEGAIFSLYKTFDVFVHVPIAKEIEAFGQTYVEALASGIPSVFTLSGIANEFISDRHNALVVPFKNSAAIELAIQELLTNKELVQTLVQNGQDDVKKRFQSAKMILSLEELYKK